MAFFVPVSAVNFPYVNRSEVVVSFFSHSNPRDKPFSQPQEVRSVLSAEEWQDRTTALWNHFARYTWSKLQRIYLTSSLFISLLGPILINIIVNRIFFANVAPLRFDASDEEILRRISLIRRAHLTNFIIVSSLLLLLWVPYLTYKSTGRKRLEVLLRSFNEADSAKGNMQALNWTCPSTSTFQSSAVILIQLPVALVSASQPSLFQQEAYLPEYIQKPNAPQAYAAPPGPPPPNHASDMLNYGFDPVTKAPDANQGASKQ
ncbi:hypothetical protein BY996DRAFT_6430397 [Phakopsora pachyrhizi]|uniref:Uncharacterized protein n=1 Tax=Phakopsora pachyrhizi TaxID=170000 RepID=A0AAV0B017_PHAPC|nr:hypothetical protein BY996DRAFT_6430397 [Phakopsora pachyrhizi]CAH7675324.1 hypothetical protein PPACK8108_LOCUS10316 [Phakopsora pachyrhizi]